MYQPLVDFFQRHDMLVLREVTTGEGRVDVVAARTDWNAAQQRLKLGLHSGLVRMPLLRAWKALPSEGALDIDGLAEALAVSRSSAQALARELVESRFALRTSDGYARRVCLPTVVTEIICCEAKLDDWRRGLAQAYGHRFYADSTYLAIANRIPRSIDYALMTQRQVGLLHVSDSVVVTLPAIVRTPPPEFAIMRQMLAERFWTHAIVPKLSVRRRGITSAVHCTTT